MTEVSSKIKARIRALSEKTVDNGCSEQEAMSAIAMVGKLLQQYNLSMDEVYLKEEKFESLDINTASKVRGGVYFAVAGIAAFTNCKVWISRGFKLTYHFFGQESDLLMARYLYDLVVAAIETETAKFKKSPAYKVSFHRKASSSSFVIGMGNRIGRRLFELKAENDREATQARGGNNALVILKNNLVESAYRDLSLRLKKNYGNTTIRDSNAARAGAAAGDRVNLSRPVNGSGGTVLRISG